MIPLTERGSKIGVHAQKTLFFDHLRQAAAQGTPFPAVKLTQENTALADVKRDSPSTLTVARVPHEHDALEGIADEPRMTEARAMEWAAVIMGHAFRYLELNPGLVQHIDVYELVNESDPNTVDGWYNLGAVMRQCVILGRSRYPTIAWGIGSFNFGTPEYVEAQAFIESGVLEEVAHGDVVLCVHEGTEKPDDPIDAGHGDLIPGAPSVPDNGGAFFGRIAYFAQLAGDKMPPVIVSEAYVHAYGDVTEVRQRAEWVDDLYSRLWYVVAWLPFTHSPTEAWKHQDYTPAYPGLIDYAGQVRGRVNATRPEPEPEPDPVEWRRAVWEASLEEQKARGITLNPEHGLEKLVYARPGYQVVHREITHRTPDGTAYGLLAAEHLGGEEPRIVLAFKRPWSGAANVEVLTEADVPEPEPEPFAWRAWPTDYRVITQTAGNNPAYYGKIAPDFEGHEGLDIRAPMGAPVYSVDNGVVSDMRQLGDAGHPYGRFVRVRHEGGYESTYAHLNSIAVGVGEPVEAGQVIAHADNTGNIVQGSSHLHVTLKRDNVIVDPTPYILPWKPNFPGLPPAAHGVTICDVSGHQGDIDFHKMMRRGAHACYIRGSIGGTGQDTRFVTNWNTIAQTPMKRGMYHLFRSDSSARRNLDNILRVVDLHGAGDLRVALDIEPVTNLPRIDGNKVTELIRMFEAELGYSPLVYTGLWVLDRTDGDRSWFLHPYLWLASYWQSPPQMNQFPQLPIGGELSKLVAHQFTSSYYDGRKWGVQSIGLDVNVVYDLDRLLVTGDAPEPPPPAPTIDMAQFFLPLPGNFGDIVILKNNWGEGDERQQLQRDGSTAYVTKNQQWERRRIGDATIDLDLDTSPGNNRYYTVETTTGWMPRHWRPGETFTRVETARFFNKGDCSPTGETLSGTSNLLFAKLHNLYTTRGGITFQNVAEIHWIRNGVTEEQYFYGGDGYGLIAWKNRGGRESWATEVIPVGQQENNTRENIPCL